MANTVTFSDIKGQIPNDAQIRVQFGFSIDTYATGGADLTTLIDTALSNKGLDASKIVDGFVNLAADAESIKHSAEFYPATRKLLLKKQGASDLEEPSAGAITAVSGVLTAFFN